MSGYPTYRATLDLFFRKQLSRLKEDMSWKTQAVEIEMNPVTGARTSSQQANYFAISLCTTREAQALDWESQRASRPESSMVGVDSDLQMSDDTQTRFVEMSGAASMATRWGFMPGHLGSQTKTDGIIHNSSTIQHGGDLGAVDDLRKSRWQPRHQRPPSRHDSHSHDQSHRKRPRNADGVRASEVIASQWLKIRKLEQEIKELKAYLNGRDQGSQLDGLIAGITEMSLY
ncbi:hypothetical protein BKA70DRAFT_1223582 [Coprinopsis sp. MPI-PUGE-AT-0042]|nr:hypothetical protein BKA70DRAFT_1223582 [Coprinopsis sp. MPI-PUGE-AT-0042]